jgi:hypothetical protein
MFRSKIETRKEGDFTFMKETKSPITSVKILNSKMTLTLTRHIHQINSDLRLDIQPVANEIVEFDDVIELEKKLTNDWKEAYSLESSENSKEVSKELVASRLEIEFLGILYDYSVYLSKLKETEAILYN